MLRTSQASDASTAFRFRLRCGIVYLAALSKNYPEAFENEFFLKAGLRSLSSLHPVRGPALTGIYLNNLNWVKGL
jgi:hypothetical protein